MRLLFVMLLVAASWLAAPGSRAADAPPAVSPQPGLLVLRNGQVLSGRLTRAGDHYFLTLESGEIRVRADEVEIACRDLEECFAHKQASIDAAKAGDHLTLAEWCLRQGLLEHAAEETARAREIEPRHPRIALLERRMQLALQEPVKAAAPAKKAEGAPSNSDLDRLLRDMAPGTVEAFSTTIQPLLQNACTTSGCHGQQAENALRLLRGPAGKAASRRLTQRNLHSVLQTINQDAPAESPLLTVPLAPHGTAQAPIFTSREAAQYRQLVQWVTRVARVQTAPQPATVERPGDHLLQNWPARRAANSPNVTVWPSPQEPVAEGRAPHAAARNEGQPPARAAKGAPPARPEDPGDPHDPDLFNRRYHK